MGHPYIIALTGLIVGILFLRPVLHFALPKLAKIHTPRNLRERVMVRYQGQNFYAWVFAWFKTGLDPMFRQLPAFVQTTTDIKSFLDLGCGYGLASSMLLDLWPQARAYGVDPNAARVTAAAQAIGNRGQVIVGSAPDFEKPQLPDRFDAAFALDMIHFLTDGELDLTLRRIRSRLDEGDSLFIRSPVKPLGSPSIKMRLYCMYARWNGTSITFRTVDQIRRQIDNAGFKTHLTEISGTNPELFWFIATRLAD